MSAVDALKEGLKKAEDARQANAAITRIFEEIGEELRASLMPDATFKLAKGIPKDSVKAANPYKWEFLVSETSEAWLVHSALAVPYVKLCEVQRSLAGFPVELNFEGVQVYCQNELELRSAVEDVLRNPRIAARLQRLIPASE